MARVESGWRRPVARNGLLPAGECGERFGEGRELMALGPDLNEEVGLGRIRISDSGQGVRVERVAHAFRANTWREMERSAADFCVVSREDVEWR